MGLNEMFVNDDKLDLIKSNSSKSISTQGSVSSAVSAITKAMFRPFSKRPKMSNKENTTETNIKRSKTSNKRAKKRVARYSKHRRAQSHELKLKRGLEFEINKSKKAAAQKEPQNELDCFTNENIDNKPKTIRRPKSFNIPKNQNTIYEFDSEDEELPIDDLENKRHQFKIPILNRSWRSNKSENGSSNNLTPTTSPKPTKSPIRQRMDKKNEEKTTKRLMYMHQDISQLKKLPGLVVKHNSPMVTTEHILSNKLIPVPHTIAAYSGFNVMINGEQYFIYLNRKADIGDYALINENI